MNKKSLQVIKEELDKWRIELRNKLLTDVNKSFKNFYLINKEWMNKFENDFLLSKLDDVSIKKKIKEKNYISFNDMVLKFREKFMDSKTNFSGIELFVLNESCYKAFQNTEQNKSIQNKFEGNYFYLKLSVRINQIIQIFVYFSLIMNKI